MYAEGLAGLPPGYPWPQGQPTPAITLRGYGIDVDSVPTEPLWIIIYVDGVEAERFQTTHNYESNLDEFETTVSAAAGNHQVCVAGVNVGPAVDTSFGCVNVTVVM